MSYYILPKINNLINVNPLDSSSNKILPYISQSLYYYYNNITDQIKDICKLDLSYNNYNELIKIVHPFEYVFSKVSGSKFSVSKLKPQTNLFYDFFEICTTLNMFESYQNDNIKSLHITNNNNDIIECFETLRENFNDELVFYNDINENLFKTLGDSKFNFLFFESNNNINSNEYFISLIKFIIIILRNQESEGSCVIKIDSIFHKIEVDILYILSSLYDKVYILKPNTSNITTFEKYIICKNFQVNDSKINSFRYNYYKLVIFLKKLEGKNIISILDLNIPYYFITKINDMNIIIGQQQLESLDLIINILKNKNKEDKIEIIKRNNIQKSVNWCEKHKIPCNKFTEKINMFFPINKEQNI
jgi:hypothetical protein